ncbi:MAG TPA: 6-carboxytetrahydropterin synthase [Chthonomonadales bacterium]|nr:6-carboxytetrahydropterin synthase [Chthonomonadales bacterium]
MYTLIVRASFDAAHDIPGHAGKCSRTHGHRYQVEAEFAGDQLDANGMLFDFADLRAAVERHLPDHSYLNEVLPVPTTAECIARWLHERLVADGLPVSATTIWETERCGCRYEPRAGPSAAEAADP